MRLNHIVTQNKTAMAKSTAEATQTAKGGKTMADKPRAKPKVITKLLKGTMIRLAKMVTGLTMRK